MKNQSLGLAVYLFVLAFCVPAEAGIVSVAVPPFENLTGEPRIDWIGVGFSWTLTEKLNKVAELSAAPRRPGASFREGWR